MEYTFNLTMNPSFGILSSKGHFVHLESRIGQVDDYMKEAGIKHAEYFDNFKNIFNLKGYLQLRRLFFNDKRGSFDCVVDYLFDELYEPKIDLVFDQVLWIMEGQPSYVDFKIINSSFASDHFDKNHRDYYMTDRVIPWTNDFNDYLLQRHLRK